MAQKEELLKMCKEKIRSLEAENKALFAQITENQEKNRSEMQKKLEDLEFYRRSYEEQRNRVNREHELISSSLYELASQFMFLKKEMQKKTDNSSKI
jgi:DNA-directed RNA polymerase alpha subunit